MMNTSITNTDQYLKQLPIWQSSNLQLFQKLITLAEPAISEEIKWGVPVFLLGKQTIFAMSAFKAHTKYNFILNGALIEDEYKLFNNGLDSKKSRGIDLKEGDKIDEEKLLKLIKLALKIV